MIIEELVTVLGVDVEAEGVPELIQGVTKATAIVAGLVAAAKTVTGALDSAFRAAAENTDLARFAAGVDQSTQVIQELEFAGERFGISIGEIRSALSGLESDLDDIAAGRGEDALVSLAKLGVDTDGLQDELDLFRRIADGFQDAVDRNPGIARGAIRDLGLGSPEFMAMLRGGTAQIDALAAEARELGTIVSGDTVDISQRYVVATERLGAAIDGFVNRHLVPALDHLTPMVDKMSEFIAQTDIEDFQIVKAFKALGDVLEPVADALDRIDEKRVDLFGGTKVSEKGVAEILMVGEHNPYLVGLTKALEFVRDTDFSFGPVTSSAFTPGVSLGTVPAGVPRAPGEIRVENRNEVVIHAGGDAREAAEVFRNERDSLTIKSLREAMRVNAGVEN